LPRSTWRVRPPLPTKTASPCLRPLAVVPSIPTGLRPKAQGCEARETLGKGGRASQPQRGCASVGIAPCARRSEGRNLVEVVKIANRTPKVAPATWNVASVATLGPRGTWRALGRNPFGIQKPTPACRASFVTCRGRDTGCPVPPSQIPAGGIPAPGSSDQLARAWVGGNSRRSGASTNR
jgi:hypothetical protein